MNNPSLGPSNGPSNNATKDSFISALDGDDDDDNCSIIDWGEENEFTSTFQQQQQQGTGSTVKVNFLSQAVQLPTKYDDVAANGALIQDTTEDKDIDDFYEQLEALASSDSVNGVVDGAVDGVDIKKVQDNPEKRESIAAGGVDDCMDQELEGLDDADFMCDDDEGDKNHLAPSLVSSRKHDFRIQTAELASRLERPDARLIKKIIGNWPSLLTYLSAMMNLDFSNLLQPLSYYLAFPRGRKLPWCLVIVNTLAVQSEEGYIYGRFQDPSDIIEVSIHLDLYQKKLSNLKSGVIILLKDVSVFCPKSLHGPCYLNVCRSNFVTALTLHDDLFYPFNLS